MFLRRAAVKILRDAGGHHTGGQGGSYEGRIHMNKVMLMGTVGQDPKQFTFPGTNGSKVTFSFATTSTFKTKEGEFKNQTEWHNIAIYSDKVGNHAMKNVHKGAKIYVEGSISTRKYTAKDGVERIFSEIRVNPFGGIQILKRVAPQQQQQETGAQDETFVQYDEGTQEQQPEGEEGEYVH